MEYDLAVGKNKVRVLVSDGSLIHTQLLSEALKRDRSLEVITAASDSKDLVAAAIARDIDILVISSTLEEQACSGLEVLREVRSSRPDIRAVVLLDSSKPEVILDAFRSGARGVFSRHESLETLCKCIRCVHQGQIWAKSHEMSLALEALASSPTVRAVGANGLNLLSKRELEIVQSLAEGLTNREIAKRLGLSQHTVKNYLFRVFDKLGVSSRVELLFMTLSQDLNSLSVFQYFLKNSKNGDLIDDAAIAECQKAAEQGLPIAQLALAQLYWTRRSGPKDAVQAYKWYLIAGEQIAAAKKHVATTMTMEQLLEAKQRSVEWLRKMEKLPPSGVKDVPPRPPLMGLSAASD